MKVEHENHENMQICILVESVVLVKQTLKKNHAIFNMHHCDRLAATHYRPHHQRKLLAIVPTESYNDNDGLPKDLKILVPLEGKIWKSIL